MVSGQQFCDIARSFDDVSEAPHFDRLAFRVARNFTTLAGDGLTANVKLTPDEQGFKCLIAPEIFAPVPNAWGKQGWTIIHLSKANEEDVHAVLQMAWQHALPTRKPRRKA